MDGILSKSVNMNLKYCFRFAHHLSNLQSKLEETITNAEITDTLLECAGFIIPCHRIILVASSNYFYKLFTENIAVKESRKPIIPIIGIRLCEMKAILHYMYRGEVEIAQEELHLFLQAAKQLEVASIVQARSNLKQDHSYGLMSPVKRVDDTQLLPLKSESIKTQTHQISFLNIGSKNFKFGKHMPSLAWPISTKIENKSIEQDQCSIPRKFESHLIVIPCQQRNDAIAACSVLHIPTSTGDFSLVGAAKKGVPSKLNFPIAHIVDDQSTWDNRQGTNDEVCPKNAGAANISEDCLKPLETAEKSDPPVKKFHRKRIFAPSSHDEPVGTSETTNHAAKMKIRPSKELKLEKSLKDISGKYYFVPASQSTPSVCLAQPEHGPGQGELENVAGNGVLTPAKVWEDYSTNSDGKLQSSMDRQIAAEALLSLGKVITN